MKFTKLACCLAGALITTGPALAQTREVGATVTVEQGGVHGSLRDAAGVLAFKGVPYAKAPVGDLRWHAPQPAPPWQGERDATHFGRRCYSALENDPEPGPPRSEDCLTLNIWTAGHSSTEKRPVMVWVHGGGFQFGSSANPAIDGTALARKGVIVVTLNYRLGVFGFFAHPDLDREGPSGDYGLQDQQAALRWVQRNIASFGGDPANVTIFGESAGAHAIGLLMASPLSHGLFAKAIGESGAFWDSKDGPLENFAEAHARGIAFARHMNAPSIAALRAMPADTLNGGALWNFTMNPMVTVFSPNVDRYVVPDVPARRFARGLQMHIPLLAGWNQVEQYPFDFLGLPHGNAVQFRAAAERMFGRDRMAAFLKLYPAGDDAQATSSAGALTGDLVIAEQTWQWLELQRRLGDVPVYGYKFTYTSPYTPIAGHVTEVPFVFGTLTPQFIIKSKTPPDAADRRFSDMVMSYWINFARNSDPNGAGLPGWPIFGAQDIVQDLAPVTQPIANPQRARFEFISSYRQHGAFPARWREIR